VNAEFETFRIETRIRYFLASIMRALARGSHRSIRR
jgi:hypothetical protein